MRETLGTDKVNEKALKSIAGYHRDTIETVREAIRANKVVVIGMKLNPFVGKARKLLTERGMDFKYLEYGGYTSQWKPRLAIKLWSGWPTFPQVFVDGRLIGGFTELKEYLGDRA